LFNDGNITFCNQSGSSGLSFHFLSFAEEAVSLFGKVSFQLAGAGNAKAFFNRTSIFQFGHFASFLKNYWMLLIDKQACLARFV